MSELLTITCPECSGEIGVPTEFIGELNCPQCGVLVYSRDADTGVTWKTSQVPEENKVIGNSANTQKCSVHAGNPSPTWNVDGQTESENREASRNVRISFFCILIGILGVSGNVLRWASIGLTDGGFFVEVLLNPLNWVGCFGIYYMTATESWHQFFHGSKS